MPFTSSGRDLALTNQDPTSALWTFEWDETGNPRFDNTGAHAVGSLLVEERSGDGHPGWIFDETGTRGSRIYLLREQRRSTRGQAVAYAKEALRRLEDAGAISDLHVNADVDRQGRLRINVRWRAVEQPADSQTLTVGT